MKYNIDTKYLADSFEEMVSVHSPTGFHIKFKPVLEKYAKDLGVEMTFDDKTTGYITLDGEDNSKSVVVSAHADTIGLVIRHICPDGKLRIRALGGVNFGTIDGESVVIYTRDGREYTGLILCERHSTHVFENASGSVRDDKTMMIILDEKVSSADEVRALGIDVGDYACIEPRCQITKSGFVKSRFIDNKGAVACAFAAIKYLTENNLKPKYKTIFTFPFWEEVGMGGCYLPENVFEFVGVDIGLIGPEQNGSEYAVSICAKDGGATYNYDITNKLIACAKKAECDYRVDTYHWYSSDAHAAVHAGHNIRHALMGMAVYGSHGMERTHIDSLANTSALIVAYVLDI